jgi:hypothetical protein
MHIKALVIAAAIGLLGVPGLAIAVPVAPSPAQTGIAAQSEFLPVRDGCGRGFHLAQWRDRWGRFHRRCVPSRGWGGDRWDRPHWGRGWGYYR